MTLPALQRGAAKAGKPDLSHLSVCGPSFVAVGRTDAELATAIEGTKKQIAFYASTPAYRMVLDLHGFGDIQPELTRLSKAGGWDQMTTLIDDDVLHAFAVVGPPEEAGAEVVRRYGDVLDRLTLYTPYDADPALMTEVVAAVRAATGVVA